MRKKTLTMAILAATALFLSGCGDQSVQQTSAAAGTEKTEAAAAAGEKTEINFFFGDGDEGVKKVMNELVDKFNAEQTQYSVRVEPGNGGNLTEFLKTKDSVGELPDVMEMRDTGMFARAGKLEALPDEIVSLFKAPMEYDGKVYTAAMYSENTLGIIYNKKYFDENGFTEPQTYDEFIALCQAIKDKGDMSPLVVGGQDLWHMGFLFNKAYDDNVMSADPQFIEHCYDGSKNFNDDSVKATFAEMQEIMQYAQDGWTSTPDAQITTFMVNNMAAMMYSGTHMFKNIQTADPNFEMGWFPIPSPDGKLRLVGGSGMAGLAISAESAKDPNKKAAAIEFLKFFFAPENYKIYLEAVSQIPTTIEEPKLDVIPVFQEVIDTLNKADTLTPMWNAKTGMDELPPDFRNFTYKTLIEVLQGSRDIDSACAEMDKTWKVALESFNPTTGLGIE